LFYKRGVQLGKIGSNLNHSEVILFTVYHAWMNDILLEIAKGGNPLSTILDHGRKLYNYLGILHSGIF